MTKFIIAVIFLTLASTAKAELYMEMSVEEGGDTLASSSSYSVNAGSGLKLALGVQIVVGEYGESLLVSLGKLTDFLDAEHGIDGKVKTSTLTLDAIYTIRRGHHRFGYGGSFHIGPTYEEDIAGSPPLKIKFDDALGLILQYSYARKSGPGFQVGVRYTKMEYKANGVSIDASNYGIFISNGF